MGADKYLYTYISVNFFSNVLSTIDIVVVFESVNTTWLNMAEKQQINVRKE